MERLGISSACYYPLETEKSFLRICKSGVRCIEVFLNTFSELKDSYVKELISIKNEYGVTVPSVHPFMSFAESYFLFSSYERRFFDSLDLYKRFFEVMNLLEAEIFVIHGAKIPGSISEEEYFDRFAKLIETGKGFNINVCQENVVHYKSQSSDFMERMKNYIGEDFGMVLDIKQAYRADENVYDFINKIGTSIKHIHISDHDAENSCIPPLSGCFDFNGFFNELKKIDYSGKFMIELYDNSYKDEQEIYTSYKKIKELLVDY